MIRDEEVAEERSDEFAVTILLGGYDLVMDLLDELQSSVLCGDGAMGTELMAAGVPTDICLEGLNVTEPDLVSKIHLSYVGAGARLLETNTFGANAARLSKHGLEQKVAELNAAAVQLAQRAVGQKPIYIAGSVGPLGLTEEEAAAQKVGRKDLQRPAHGSAGGRRGCYLLRNLPGL